MKLISFSMLACLLVFGSCKTNSDEKTVEEIKSSIDSQTSFRIALGSCNRQNLPQDYWAVIEKDSADIFVWGGDNIYADTPDMQEMKAKYETQKSNPHYQSFLNSLPNVPLGVWDDHDYGKNDAGKEWEYKDEAKALFLDFLDIDSTHPVAQRAGTYYSEVIPVGDNSIKFYMLDSRYFRDGLLDAEDSSFRYQPHITSDSTLLGSEQWKWFEEELKSSEADFNIIVSSIQFLSSEHGFETWGNFPHEVEKMQNLLETYSPKNVLIFSGDRHISEFSQKELTSFSYPLTDFTSSGLTHSYTSYDGEPNQYRVGEVVYETSYGIVDLDFKENTAELYIKSTDDAEVLERLKLKF